MKRCAIYTRKSSEEGLEQEFNSLYSQREACEAYIRSQKHEGWGIAKALYDDGGLSGGTMARPALQALLDDIASGKIDIVVVYKVDRLTRSLADFAKIVELFDAKGVSFVSVTQQFNTTSSMGRLTLNVLLSFAQFEREVTGERIRDKIAASKKKGMWMGGNVPIGYDAKDRKLAVNQQDAAIIRALFELYIERGSTRLVAEAAAARGYCTPKRLTKSGGVRGGRPLSKGHIDQILTNRVYLGEIPHKDKSYPGAHDAIIDKRTWDRAQAIRQRNRAAHRTKTNDRHPSLLAGLLFDPSGEPMMATHANKGGKRYRYYVSRPLVRGVTKDAPRGLRIPATDLEALVSSKIEGWLKDANAVIGALGGDHPLEMAGAAERFAARIDAMAVGARAAVLSDICERIDAAEDAIRIKFRPQRLLSALGRKDHAPTGSEIMLTAPAGLTRVGGETRLLTPEDAAAPIGAPDPAIVRVLAKARDWAERLASGAASSLKEIASSEDVSPRYVARLLPLAFLAPALVDRLLAGDHPKALTAERLTRCADELALCWRGQSARLIAP